MTSISPELSFSLVKLGNDLRAFRRYKYPSDTQEDFAARIDISRATYIRMEKGDPKVAAGSYFKALALFGQLHKLNGLFAPPPPGLLEGIEI